MCCAVEIKERDFCLCFLLLYFDLSDYVLSIVLNVNYSHDFEDHHRCPPEHPFVNISILYLCGAYDVNMPFPSEKMLFCRTTRIT